MKFRGVINDPSIMKELQAITTMLSRINKDIVCTLEPTLLSFIVSENYVQGTPWIWSEIGTRDFFSEYVMQGVDPDVHNKIVMSFNSLKLCKAFTMPSKGMARYIKMKLTNRQFPCLTIELEIPSACSTSGQYRKVVHDVPISLIATRDWSEFDVPSISTSSRSITLPSARSLRNLVDKIKNLSPSLTIYYNNVGDLSLVVETDLATVSSHYRNLTVSASESVQDPCSADEEMSCRVSSKQLAMFFASNQLANVNMSCSIKQDVSFNVLLEVRPNVSVHCRFPVVAL